MYLNAIGCEDVDWIRVV